MSTALNPAVEHALARSGLLRFVAPELQAELLALLHPRHCEFGERVVQQGEPADAWYLLVRGRVRVLRQTDRGEEISLARLLPGDTFGESAMLDGGLRDASVRASTRVELLRLARSDLLALLQRAPALRQSLDRQTRWRSLQGFLLQHSVFGDLPDEALDALLASLQPHEVAAGQTILRHGDAPDALYILQRGRAHAWRPKPEDPQGREHLAAYRSGDFFGERALLTGEPRAASVTALDDCQLLALDRESVDRLRTRFPAIEQRLQLRLAEYQHRSSARVPLDFADELLPAEASPQASAVEDNVDASLPPRRSGAQRRWRRFPFVAQIDEMDCGAACLAMVCTHFGLPQRLSRLRELCHTDREGTRLSGICHAAGEVGLAARALKVSAAHLDELPLPAICHWKGNHWLVLYAVDGDRVRVADPAVGRRTLSRAQFLADWSGYAALFDFVGTPASEPPSQAPSLFSWLPGLLRGHGTSLTLAVLLAGLASLLGLLFPVFTQFVIDQVIVDQDLDLLVLVLGSLAATLGFLLLAQLIQQYLLAFLAVRFDSAALDLLTRRLLALPMRYFSSRRTGDLVRRLEGARQVRQFLVQQGIGGALALLQLLAASLLMLVYSPLLGAVFLALLPLYAVLMLVARQVLRPLYADIEEAHGRYASQQIDAIRGIEAVKVAAAESAFRDQMLGQFLTVARQQFRGNFVVMAYDSALQALGFATLLAFLWFGAQEVIAGQLSVGALVAFNSLLAMASDALLKSLGAWDEWQHVSVLLNRLRDLFEHSPEQGEDRSRLLPVPSLQGHVALDNVRFRYGGPQGPVILDSINLEFVPGRRYALVGRSGSGKSTLVKLIAGLVEPGEGRLRFDRLDSATLNHRELRRQIGFVLQETHLFDQTVLANIAFGDAEPDLERAQRAARLACAHDFISRLPLGYDTRVGDSGLGLSGGQKQRIALARALYHDPPILILDEATSALDSESERLIQDNLAEITRGRTCILIAHRLSTVRDADEIIVLERGQVAERGTHQGLLDQRGLYFYLHSQQLGL